MVSITTPRDGAVLNAHHGCETNASLVITVEGINDTGCPVRINGVIAEQDGIRFSARLELTQKINRIEAAAQTAYGEFIQRITVVWDKKSFRRCCFYIDDHSFLFTELARSRPRRAFDHFYLAALKKIHDRYGWKVTLNTFYRNDHDPEHFTLDRMPDIWKNEFIDNSSWLRFALHSYSEFPDRPYVDADRKTFLCDYNQMHDEIRRFAGEESFIVPQAIHWGNISPGVADELIKAGMRCYSEAFRPRLMVTPPAEELSPEERSHEFRSEVYLPADEALARHYGFREEIEYMDKHTLRYDSGLGIFFMHDWIVCNLLPLEKIPRLFAIARAAADRSGCDLFAACGHEQYSFPSYFNYQPDHFRKLEETIRLMVEEGGCTPVFVQNGLLGNTAWGE